MQNRLQFKLNKISARVPITNTGWNNFDPNVSNGYKFNPGQWRGMYKQLYLTLDEKPKADEYGYVPIRNVEENAKVGKGFTDDDCVKVIMSNNPRLEGVPQMPESFEKVFCETHGSIKIVETDENLNILRYKTWWQGEISPWITFDPSVKGKKPKEAWRNKTDEPLKLATAHDLLQLLYSDTMTKICLDLEHRVLDSQSWLEGSEPKTVEEETELRNEIDHKVGLIKGVLQVLADNFVLGKDDERLCKKYNIKSNN